jgi:hypothetical protein
MFVHVSFQTDGSGQDGFEGTGLETFSWIVSHGKNGSSTTGANQAGNSGHFPVNI